MLISGHVVWRCSKFTSARCKATVVTNNERIVKNENPEHTHEANTSVVLAKRAVGEMKQRLVDNLAAPSATLATVTSNLPNHVLMTMPKKTVVARSLRRYRQNTRLLEGNMNMMAAIPIDTNFLFPQQFVDFLLHDSGPGDDRMLIFGCNELLDGLARAPIWLADGTFKVVPSIFFQLYTIHFQLVEGINPAALYCLLMNKTRATYDRLLTEVQRLVPTAAPTKILTDFESAAMGSCRNTFPNAIVTGCYFHLYQSVTKSE